MNLGPSAPWSGINGQFYSLIEHYGYLVVFFGVMLGTASIRFPGTAILLTSGVLVQQGHLGRGGTVAFGVLGAIVGNQLGYWVGHRAGREPVLTGRRYVKLTPGRPEWVEGLFARHGGKAVFAGRFFSALRVLETLVAGTSRMHWGTFVFYSVLDGTIWATAVVLAGYYFGQGWGNTQPWSRLSYPFLSYCSGRRRAPSSPTGGRPPAGVDRLS
jgi:membrane protein DedA with SNARE-associated domain